MMDGSSFEACRGLGVVEPERLEQQPTPARPILGQILQTNLDQPRVLEIERLADPKPALVDRRQPGHDLPELVGRPRLMEVRCDDADRVPYDVNDRRLGEQLPQEWRRQDVEGRLLAPGLLAVRDSGAREQLLDEA